MKTRAIEEFAAPEIMLIPLVDVILMLLTFFLLGTNFKQAQGMLESHLPTAGGPGPRGLAGREELVIRCTMPPGHQFPVYRLGDVSYPTVGDLEAALALFRTTPDQPVTIDPDPTAPYERVLWVLNSCVKLGFTTVAFAAPPIPTRAAAGGP